MPRLARSLFGWRGFSCQSVTASWSSSAEDAEAVRLADGHGLDRDRHVRALAPVLLDERAVVHLVDVVAGQDEHDVGAGLVDRLDVWGTASAVPRYHSRARSREMYGCMMRMPPVLRSRSHGRPSADVVVERPRVVLRQDDDVVDVRVHAVARA